MISPPARPPRQLPDLVAQQWFRTARRPNPTPRAKYGSRCCVQWQRPSGHHTGLAVPPKSLSLTNAVVGCTDIDLSARFWAELGFTRTRSERIPAEVAATVYGLQRSLETLDISAPGSSVGWIRLVETHGSPRIWRPHLRGRCVLEIVARELDAAESIARSAGARVAGRTDFARGDRRNREVRLLGPDEVEIGLTQSSASASSPLLVAGRELTEIVNILWLVESVEEAKAGLPELEVFSELSLDAWTPAHEFLGLPDPAPAIGIANLGEPGALLMRLQLLEVTGQALEVEPSWPIRPGVFAVGCEGPVPAPTCVERTGGVRLEIWPTRS